MTDGIKENMLDELGSSPESPNMDFSRMSDEDLMKMDVSDIFLEDLDRFLAEKKARASRREMTEARAQEVDPVPDADKPAEAELVSEREPDAADNASDAAAETETPADQKETDTAADTAPPADREETDTAADTETPVDQEETDTAAETPADQEETDTAADTETPADQEETDTAAETPEDQEETETEAPTDQNDSEKAVVSAGAEVSPEENQKAEDSGEAATSEAAPAELTEEGSAETGAEKSQETAAAIPAAAGTGNAQNVPPVAPPPVEEPKKKPGIAGLIFVGALLCCAVIAIAAAYFYYADYFSARFYPGTVINDRNVSVMGPAEVKQDIANEIVTYHLDINELNDVKETITSEDIGLAYVDDGAVDKILNEQDTKLWFVKIFGTKTYTVSTGTTYDREKAEQVINNLNCLKSENITPPQDAQLVDNGTSFSIQPEVEGNQLDEEKFRTMVYEALDAGETEIDIVKDDCYLHPSVRSDNENLNTRMNEYNSILGVNVYYVFGENTEYVNADTLRQFITDDGNHVTLAGDYARKLVYGWGQKYDTFGLAREFKTHSGEIISLPAGGDYGWVINKDVTIADVQNAVETQASGERTPTFLYSAMGWDNGDITGTYVEVSISEQKLWCYHNYELVMETDVVTGLPTPERETKRGIYAIDAKKENATLGRLDVQGYASPVSFWAPFDGGRGLHDAPWRGSFGGNIYQYDGSHGCVNIPEENMEAIYNAIEIGNAVIVY